MRKLLLLGATAAALSVAGTAQAASCVTTVGGVDQCVYDPISDPVNFSVTFNPDGTISAGLKHDGINSGAWQDIFFFIVDDNGVGSGSVTTSTSFLGGATDLDFTDAEVWAGATLSFNAGTNAFELSGGTVHELTLTGNDFFETAFGNNIPLFAGENNYIVFTGNSGSNGSYGGQATFVPEAAVPEPATWAMMLFGFGAIGFAMRRRRKENVRVRFAM